MDSNQPSIGFDPSGLTAREGRVMICGRCGALVPDDKTRLHVEWHATLSMERWPDLEPRR